MKFSRLISVRLFVILLLLPSTASSGFLDPFTALSKHLLNFTKNALSRTDGAVLSRFQKQFDSLADFFNLDDASLEFGVFDKKAGESFKFDFQGLGNQRGSDRNSYEDYRDQSNHGNHQSKGLSLRTAQAAVAAMALGFGFLIYLVEQAWPHSTDGYTYHPPDGKYEFHGDNADRGNWWEGNVHNDGRPKQTEQERQEQQLRDFLQHQQASYEAYAKQMEWWRREELERRREAAQKDFRGSPLEKPSIPTDLAPEIITLIEQAEATQEAAAQAAAQAPPPEKTMIHNLEDAQAIWAQKYGWLDDVWALNDDTWDDAKQARNEICLLHTKESDDSAIGILNGANRTLTRTIDLVRTRYYETVENPLPAASAVAACACLPAYAIGLAVGWELLENRRELWQESKKFARLMRDDTPEGVARLLTFCVELAALHKVTGAMLPVVDAAMPRIKETVNSLVKLAEQERQLAATAGDGLVLRPFNDMLEGMRAAMRVSKEEFLLETASTSATEGTNAASSIKQRLTKEAGATPGTLKAAEGGLGATSITKTTVEDLQKEFIQGKNTRGLSTVFSKPPESLGSYADAVSDFYRLDPSNIESSVCKKGFQIKTGNLPDGRTVVVRESSKDGRPTLEIQFNDGSGRRTKFRYG